MDETLLEIATDKVDSEVPSTTEGTLEEVLFQVNDVVSVGTVIARIRTGQEATSAPSAPVPAPTVASNEVSAKEHAPVLQEERPISNGGARFYSPLVLNIAGSEGVSLSELENIPGSGNDGRVTKKDILQYVADKKAGNISAPKSMEIMVKQEEPRRAPETSASAPVSYSGNVEIIEMDRMRKMISKHMIESTQTSAHVTSFSEADVTNMVLWRERVKKDFEKREGEKITFTPLFVEAVVRCIKKFPWLNSSVEGDKIIVKKDINIGMAAALPNGNLIVPVIKGADQLNLVGLTKQVNQLANAARNNKLKPDDTAGGTFTLTNVGTFGSIMGTPIINQPQVAILAVGAIKKRPVVIETEQGDSIAIRHMMYLSLSYDHRIIDGGLGSTFLNAVTKELENFNPEKEW